MNKLIIQNRYATIPNELLNNPNLSLKAKGLFAYLQGKPENWRFSVSRMATQLKEGKDAIRQSLKELEDSGYLSRKSIKNQDGTWGGCDYILAENPSSENPPTDNPPTDNPDTLSNKDDSKKEYSNIDINTCKQSLPVNEILNEFYEINPTLNYGNKTQRTAVEELLKKFGKDELIAMIQQYRTMMSDRFCPVATTPIAFKAKLGDIIAFFTKIKQREQNDYCIDIPR
jgi:hypothetical protein